MGKRFLAMWMQWCEGKLKVKIASHFRLPSASQKRACLSSLFAGYRADIGTWECLGQENAVFCARASRSRWKRKHETNPPSSQPINCRINMNCWRFFMTVILFWRKENFATDLQLKVGRNKCSISSLRTSIGQILSPLACNAKGPKGDRAWDLHDIWLFISYSCSADVLLTWTREPWSSLDLD